MILVTGGCGFIGSNFVLDWISTTDEPIIVLDKLTYAGNLANLVSVQNNKNLNIIKGDINDRELVSSLLNQYKPRALLNFAAESHVDRSIHGPEEFVSTNINGTFCLLEAARQYLVTLNPDKQKQFRFLQVSTDEVYGSLTATDLPFTETTNYSPNNPYSASKAAADHLVNAYYHTYQLPTLITNCSNNYGPYQFPEKLIPFTILNALQGKPLLVYGDGLQIRDWLFVSDHCNAIRRVLSTAQPGTTYNIGGHCEKTNIDIVRTICEILTTLKPATYSYSALITHIADRPGHDRRYAINADNVKKDLGWVPSETFDSGIYKTVSWYLSHLDWVNTVKDEELFNQWIKKNYTQKEIA